MSVDTIPSPPVLSCDSRKCTLRSSLSYKVEEIIDHEPKTPKDLPGSPKNSINPDSFFPYDDSSSKYSSPVTAESENKFEQISPVSTVSTESLHLPSPLSNTPVRSHTPIKTVMSQSEQKLLDSKFVALKTFILKTSEETIMYMILLRSYYGDSFIMKFNEKTIMGEEKIFLFETDSVEPTFIVSDKMTKYLNNEPDIITLFNDSLMFEGVIYSASKTQLTESYEVFHPSSYRVLSESLINKPDELSITAHKHALDIESIYREELKESYNNLIGKLGDILDKVQMHHETFSEVDSLVIKETDKYYDKFVKKINEGNPLPLDEDINRITFLNETSLKYIQTHFIFWNRLNVRFNNAKLEFEDTIQSIYLQMKKDFPTLEGIPIDPSIDVERSYPGKIFSK
jgi:hypothetical protein